MKKVLLFVFLITSALVAVLLNVVCATTVKSENSIYIGSELYDPATYAQYPVSMPFLYATDFNTTSDMGYLTSTGNVPLLLNLQKSETLNFVPVFVFYLINGSNANTDLQNSLTSDLTHNLTVFINALDAIVLQETALKKKADIILNPDLMGYLESRAVVDPVIKAILNGTQAVPVKESYAAFYAANINSSVKDLGLPTPDNVDTLLQKVLPPSVSIDSFSAYVYLINYLLHLPKIHPYISYGWTENIWAGADSHVTIHHDRSATDGSVNMANITAQATAAVQFADAYYFYGVTGLTPDFIVFDKYAVDNFRVLPHDPTQNYVFQGYYTLYNAGDWNGALRLIQTISESLKTDAGAAMPVMLWQIPGGHVTTMVGKDTVPAHSEFGDYNTQYFFGDTNLQKLTPVSLPLAPNDVIQSPTNYNYIPTMGENSVFDYLSGGASPNFDISHIANLEASHVFAILFGGAYAVGVYPYDNKEVAILQQSDWLKAKLSAVDKSNADICLNLSDCA